jgi:hypothetical protein
MKTLRIGFCPVSLCRQRICSSCASGEPESATSDGKPFHSLFGMTSDIVIE